MIRTIPIQDLPPLAQDLITHMTFDEEIIIEQAGQPVARVTSLAPVSSDTPAKRLLGFWKDKIWVSSDFDDELPVEFWCPPDDPLAK